MKINIPRSKKTDSSGSCICDNVDKTMNLHNLTNPVATVKAVLL